MHWGYCSGLEGNLLSPMFGKSFRQTSWSIFMSLKIMGPIIHGSWKFPFILWWFSNWCLCFYSTNVVPTWTVTYLPYYNFFSYEVCTMLKLYLYLGLLFYFSCPIYFAFVNHDKFCHFELLSGVDKMHGRISRLAYIKNMNKKIWTK